MVKFNINDSYSIGDRVFYKDSCYECLVDNPDTSSTPDEYIYWKETWVKISDVVMRGYTESATLHIVKIDSTFDIDIIGYNFDSSIDVSIPNCTINSTIITSNKISLNVTASNIVSTNIISITKQGVPNDGVELQLEISDTLSGNGNSGTFLTDFSAGGTGASLWGSDWDLKVFGTISSIDTYFKSSSAGTPSSSTGPSTGIDGKYCYVESSNPNNGTGQYGTATTSNFKTISSIEFDYHMYGRAIGDLTTQGFNGTDWVTLDTLSGEQQSSQNDHFLHKNIPCSNLTKVRFLFNSLTNATSYTADISIDNIKIISS